MERVNQKQSETDLLVLATGMVKVETTEAEVDVA